MKTSITKTLLLTLVTITAAILFTHLFNTRAAAQQQQVNAPAQRWQYGTLTIADGDPLFSRPFQQFNIKILQSNYIARSDENFSFTNVNVTSSNNVNPTTLALDTLGAAGWESYAVSYADHKVIYSLRRPY